MATRMQQRKGTAAQWISTNSGQGPVLNAGEIGFEIDTNKFKIGDGVNHWVDLVYFTDSASALAAINAVVDAAPAALNTLNELAAAINDDPAFFTTMATNLANHEADTTNVHGIADTALLATKSYADNAVSTHNSDTTNVHGILDTADLATQDYVLDQIANSTDAYPDLAGDGIAWDAVNEAFDADNTIARVSYVQEGLDLKANIDSPTFTGTVAGVTKAHVGLGNVDNTSDENKPLSTAATTALNLKAPLAGPVFTGTTRTDDLIVDGDFTVNGTNFAASATSITIEDNILQLAHQNPANTVDLGIVVSYNYNEAEGGMHAGLVRDASESLWKLFKNVEAEPSTTVDFANGELDALQVGGLYASSAVIGGVNDTEIQYLNGVTSAIQDQLDDKLESATAASTYAPIASPTFTGTVSGVTKAHVGLGNVDNTADADKDISDLTQAALDLKAPLSSPTFTGTVAGIDKSMVGLGNVDNTADLSKPISSATQTELDLKANINGPTLTGTVTLPSSTSIGDVTSTEIGYLEGVTSAIQDQINAKLSTITASTSYAPLASPTFTGTVSGINKSMVGLENVDNTSDADKPISTATQTALDAKAPLASPTFTGTVAGITKTMVGLANVDNTADTDKPISTDTQAALDLKAPLANPTFTGTVAGITKSMVGLGSVDNTSDASKPISSATQTALDAKLASSTAASTYAPIANPTFTGTVAGVTKAMVGLGNVDNTSDASKPISTATQTALDLKAPKSTPTFTGTVTASNDLVVDGNLTVNGTTFNASSTSITIEDNMVQLAHQNAANTVDLGLVVGYNDGASKHAGLVRDVSDAKWKLFKGVTTEPTTTVDFTQGSLDDLEVAALTATTVTPSSGVVFSDGTQTKAAAPSLVTITSKTADYTLSALTERDSMIEMNSGSATTLTVPPNSSVAYPVGTSIDVLRVGAGAVTVAAGAGVTLNYTPGNKLRAQWSSATLVKRATDTWVLLGDLSA